MQISTFLYENNLLTNRQSGFRAKHSCTTALIDVAEDLRKDIDNGLSSILVLLDHSKAFDTVDHHILSQKLKKNMYFAPSSLKLMNSYLYGRSQCVKSCTGNSGYLPTLRAVPQGSILGPLLFSMYANDIPQQLKYCKVRMYADDVQLYISSYNHKFDDCVNKLNDDLGRISTWAAINGLSINLRKSKCLIIQKRSSQTVIEPLIQINNQQIEIVTQAKNLGVVFNNTLTWSDHIIATCGKMFSMLRTLWPLHGCTPLRIRTLLAKTYLIPVLTYSSQLFSSCDYNSKRKLNTAYNAIIRYIYIYGLKRYDHISTYTKKLYGVLFDDYLKIKCLVFLHKLITTKEPNYLYTRLLFSRSTRGRNLIQFRHRSLISEWQYYIYSIRLWNTLPTNIKSTSNTNLFKKYLFDLFSQ